MSIGYGLIVWLEAGLQRIMILREDCTTYVPNPEACDTVGLKLTVADLHPTEFPFEWIGRIHNLRPSNPRHEQYTWPEQ
jgi:hypothetical protein